ncbi:hypothetical protein NSQ26_13060 [Bacillus sp. FSL W7-1360]
MTEAKQREVLVLSTDEIAAALFLCGYGAVATEMFNTQQRFKNEEERDHFSYNAEMSLKKRGYWDDDRDKHLVEGFESFVHLLMKAQKRVRCVRGNAMFMLHNIDGQGVIIQTGQGRGHVFELVQDVDQCSEALRSFYEMKEVDEVLQTKDFTVTVDFFERLRGITIEQLNMMIEQGVHDDQIRQFLKDFRTNELVFDNIAFMRTDYAVKSKSDLLEVQFLLESDVFVWYIDYQNIGEKKEVHVYPVEKNEYLGRVTSDINEWFAGTSD